MEKRVAGITFRRSQAVVVGVSLSLFALLVGGMLFFALLTIGVAET